VRRTHQRIVHSAVGYEMMIFEIETKLWHCQEQQAIPTSVPTQSLKRQRVEQTKATNTRLNPVADGLPQASFYPGF
jgi:hypothetical protein